MQTSSATKSREVFAGFDPAQEILWYFLATFSVIVFVYGVARQIAKYRRSHKGDWPPLSELPARFRRALRIVASHISISRRDWLAGWAHRGIFYGFLVLFIGTVILAINTDFTEPVFGWTFFKGDFYLVYSLILDLLGIALLVGLLAMMVRRAVIRPRKLNYARPDREEDGRTRYRVGDWVFVLLLLFLVVSGYVLEGARIAVDSPGYNEFSPIGWITAQGLTGVGLGTSTIHTGRETLWWLHGLVAISFVASIPYTKASHMIASFTSLVIQDPKAGKKLEFIPPERATEPAGYGSLVDFSGPHLLQLDACTKCGKCHEACPAMASNLPLSPRDVVLELREQSNSALRETGIGGVIGMLIAGAPTEEGPFAEPVIGKDGVNVDTVWSCMQCNACVEACPVGIEQAPIINQLRRRLVEEGEMPPNLQSTLQAIQKSGNSFGERSRRRGKWTQDLDFDIADARKQPVDSLWFVGDYASFDPRNQHVTRTVARLFQAAGLDFGILYDGENNSGNDVRRAGEEGLFESLAERNIAQLESCDFDRIVTTDPHAFNTLRNEYPSLLGDDLRDSWNVVHHTTLLLELIESGALPIAGTLSYRVTYHDPCYLGRHNGAYDDPRKILEVLGCELVEMPRNRDNSFCCGAGGGRIWIPDEPGASRPSEDRIREAVSLSEVDYFIVSCPKDVTMYEDAIKTTGNSDRLELKEMTELLEEGLSRLPAHSESTGSAA